MFVYGLTKKQCGVIFANIKRGNLNLADDFANWMYTAIADSRVFADNSTMSDVFARMKSGLEAIFANNYEAANEELAGAYKVYHCSYKA